jgi:poly(A) polymerase Pap1
MSSIKGIRNLTGLLLKLVPHRKLNGRQCICRKYFAKRTAVWGKIRFTYVYL